MKSMINSALVTILLVTLAGTAAFGKTKKGKVSFTSDVKVSGTTVKRGDYDAVFDESKNELSIVKSGKVVAKTSARVEELSANAKWTSALTNVEGNETALVGITFAGTNQNVVITQAAMQAGGGNN